VYSGQRVGATGSPVPTAYRWENRKSVTLAAQSMQAAGLISYRRGKIQVLDRPGLERASCECYAVVKERFDAFLTPPLTAIQGNTKGRRE
jgi:hypothetical protein